MSPSSDQTVIEGQKRALELAVHGAPLAEILDTLVRTIEAQSANDVLGSIMSGGQVKPAVAAAPAKAAPAAAPKKA